MSPSIRYRAHQAHGALAEARAEEFVASFRLVSSDEHAHHGRYLLKGRWSWAEVVTLVNGVYVGGDIETVVFQGHRSRDAGPRAPLYWMATRSYGYAREKATAGDVVALTWERELARECVIWLRRDRQIGADDARDLCEMLGDSESDQSHFVRALHDAGADCDDLSAGEVVADRVLLACALLRKLTVLLEERDYRAASKEWFREHSSAA